MSKFNSSTNRPSATRAASSVVQTKKKRKATAEGGPGWTRDKKSELFLLGVANFVGEGTFYEAADDRDKRYADLVKKLATNGDYEWVRGFLTWLRGEGNMRSAPLVGAVEAVRARLNAKLYNGNRQLVDAVLQRPDEPGEMLAYYHQHHGRSVPMPIKNGINDAVRRMYSERSLLKYDTDSKHYRFGDVIEICHPAPHEAKPWQGDLFEYAIDRRHGRANGIPESLGMLRRNALLRSEADPKDWLNPELLGQSGMTWEDALSAVGSKVDKAKLWEAIIPSMGYMALLRNLRNFDQEGVSNAVAKRVAAKLADPAEVAASRQLPMRFLSAYREARDDRWTTAISEALELSLGNIPELRGNTLILIDRSGSMFSTFSRRSTLTAADAAAVFGVALARRAEKMDLIQFGTASYPVGYKKGESVLKIIDRFRDLGGTNTAAAVHEWYKGHDRVVLVTDEQAYWHASYEGGVFAAVPVSVPCYTWNLNGYRVAGSPSGANNRHTFGGLSDGAFRMISLIEAGQNADWPWVVRPAT